MTHYRHLFGLEGRTALVTGGATGIGRMATEALLRAGAHVLIASRKKHVCETAAAELSDYGRCTGFAGDISTDEGVRSLSREVREHTDRLDILVNSAAATWGMPFEEFNRAAWDRVLSTNLTGTFMLVRDLMPMLLASATSEQPSRIVNIGSAAGTVALADDAYSYVVSKAGVHHLTRVLANEFAERNVTVNCIAPGPFKTRLTQFVLDDAERERRAAAAVPRGRLGKAEDVAAAILYLCGPGASFVTGAILPVDGGMSVQARRRMFED